VKPNSKTRAAMCVRHTENTSVVLLRLGGRIGHRFEVPWRSDLAATRGGKVLVKALAMEFRAVRKQALLSAAAEIERLRASCVGVNDYELGLATALEAVREMAAPKRRKGP